MPSRLRSVDDIVPDSVTPASSAFVVTFTTPPSDGGITTTAPTVCWYAPIVGLPSVKTIGRFWKSETV